MMCEVCNADTSGGTNVRQTYGANGDTIGVRCADAAACRARVLAVRACRERSRVRVSGVTGAELSKEVGTIVQPERPPRACVVCGHGGVSWFDDTGGGAWRCCSPSECRANVERDVLAKLAADDDDGYDALREVFRAAVEQASAGKGKERHANEGEPFCDQQIVKFGEWLGSADFQIGQACKKAIESKRLPPDRADAEILGAINYLGAARIVLRRLAERAGNELTPERCGVPECRNMLDGPAMFCGKDDCAAAEPAVGVVRAGTVIMEPGGEPCSLAFDQCEVCDNRGPVARYAVSGIVRCVDRLACSRRFDEKGG